MNFETSMVALGAGLVVSGLRLWLGRWRWRSRARACEVRVAMLERALAERDEALARGDRPPAPDRRLPPSAL